MWCDKCKHSVEGYPREVIIKVEDTTEMYENLVELIIPKQLVNELKKHEESLEEFIARIREEKLRNLERTYRDLKSRYTKVLWCSKLKTFVVCNPDKPTTIINKSKVCKFFELRE